MSTSISTETGALSPRHADLDALEIGARIRWGIVGAAILLFAIGPQLRLSDVSIWLLVIAVTAGGIGNVTIHGLLRDRWYRQWLKYAYCTLDVLLVGLVTAYLGPGGSIAAFLMIVLPSAHLGGRALGLFSLLTSSVVYPITALVHWWLSGGPDLTESAVASTVLVDMAVFIGVSIPMLLMAAADNRRLSTMLSVICRTVNGALDARVPTKRSDQLGLVAAELNTMLEQMAARIKEVMREVRGATAICQESVRISQDAHQLRQSAQSLAQRLAADVDDIRIVAESVQTETTNTAHEASHIRTSTERYVRDASELADIATVGGQKVAAAFDVATVIVADLRKASELVDDLAGMSRQISSATLTIAKIARHTHVLALNAAIEAARAEEHGKEFAVLAERVRNLAAEAGRSARDVGDLISEAQSGITAAANAITTSGEKANEISLIVTEARAALHDLRVGTLRAADSFTATAYTSQTHAEHVGTVAERMSQLASKSERWAENVQDAIGAMTDQISTLGEFERTTNHIADLAGRLNELFARYLRTQG